METIPTLAVLGAQGSHLILGLFMLIQSILDPYRRKRFLYFSITWFSLSALDILFMSQLATFSVLHYEFLRILWCGLYILATMYLIGYDKKINALVPLVVIAIGYYVFFCIEYQMATSISFPIAFWVTGYFHYKEFKRTQYFASCILWVFSTALGLSCAMFYSGVKIGNNDIIYLGYLHYAILAIFIVFQGWINYPRELRGLSPVRINPIIGRVYFCAITAFELLFISSLLVFYQTPPILYILSTGGIIVATIVLILYYRNELVIYTGNVTKLLEIRTESLKKAQKDLAVVADNQAKLIISQETELGIKSTIIDKQRRLELAAQTAGQIAHDIQNIISPISVELEILKKAQESAAQISSYKTLKNQTDLLFDLNSQLLCLARRGKIEKEFVNVNEILTDALKNISNHKINIDIKGSLWTLGSWSHIVRALQNILLNAVEANDEEKGPIEVNSFEVKILENKQCHLGFIYPGEYACIQISDHGPGIPEQVLDKIFEPFFSTKRGTKRSGSGLGLSIVSSMIEDHEAFLDIETSPSGTTIKLYFHLETQNAKEVSGNLLGNATVYVIDDDSLVLSDIKTLLEKYGYTVVTASDGKEAIDKAQIISYDLIILDYHLGQLNGWQVFYALTHLNPGIPVILNSSFIPEDELVKFKQYGVHSYLTKPINPLLLLKEIQYCIKKHSTQ